jgi:flagellar L-ring protein precursor FlgH
MRIATLARIAAVGFAFAGLSACSTVKQTLAGPSLTPMGYPAALTPQTPQILTPARDMPAPASANSLWRTGARAFFIDQRAARVGDIVTVQIAIDDKADTSNTSTTSRKGAITAGIPNLLGLESSLGRALPAGFDPANAIGTNTSSTGTGSGSVSRAEKINLTIAAVVTQVLPNGNLVLKGRQQVRVNYELRELDVEGIIRPMDISTANEVPYDQIAEARIAYGGKGTISDVQQPRYGQQVYDILFPF